MLAEADLGLFVSSSGYRTDVEESQIRSILERRPEALVLTGLTHTGAARDLLRGFGIPVVETWETGDAAVDMAVGYSNREAAHAMTRGADPLRLPAHRLRQRSGREQRARAPPRRGLSRGDAGGGAGGAADPRRPRRGGDPARDRGAGDAGASARTTAIDAVFFTSDVFAVGAILACREQGIAVPERMGIAGFHDLEIGRVVSPTLTTVHVPAMEMGRKAGQMILARLAGKRPSARRHDLGFSIIARESTRRGAVRVPRLTGARSYR